jgi:pyridoxal phosphate enzyme (YggS family)
VADQAFPEPASPQAPASPEVPSPDVAAQEPAAPEAVCIAERLGALGLALPASTRLLAVSKGQSAERIREAVLAGQRSFGESRLQEASAKQLQLLDLGTLDWHFIGRLQANKARAVLRQFATIHSLDSLELARRLARIAVEERLEPQVFFQVKLRPDPGKGGFEPQELLHHWQELQSLQPLRPLGLMTIAPLGLQAADRLALFQECAALAGRLGLAELSMGMSGDWREAAAAGSTWVRIGSGLFGNRNPLATLEP